MDRTELHVCPFCGFKDPNDYRILLHVEVEHSEDGDSPFAVKEPIATASARASAATPLSTRSSSPASTQSPGITYIECPYQCGERVPAAELQFHTDFHLAENMSLEDGTSASALELSTGPYNDEQAVQDISKMFDTNIPSSLRDYNQLSSSSKSKSSDQGRRSISLKELFFGSPNRKRVVSQQQQQLGPKTSKIKRLGTAELGPYAHEKRMPSWLQRMLEEGANVTIHNKIGPGGALIRVETIENETPNLVPVLARLSLLDQSVARAFYCSPKVRHIAKMAREGGFCGYRNIQMLVSHIQDAQAPGWEHFPGRTPSILRLQDMIENAWDMGFNSIGRLETGGIKLTRRYIGTPEAQALFLSLDVPCEAMAYTSRGNSDAYASLMAAIFSYFEDDSIGSDEHRVFITRKPPIYFQHQGHSMTIIGVEVHMNGNANLVVFDPMYNPSSLMKKLTGVKKFRYSEPARLMKAYRRGEAYLSKYKDFELLKLSDPTPDVSHE